MPIAEELAYFISHFESIASMQGLSEKETINFLSTFLKNYPAFEKMKDEVDYYRLITHLRLIEICDDGSSDKGLNKQMKAIAKQSKKAIFSPLIS